MCIAKESLLSPFWTPPQKMPDFDEAQYLSYYDLFDRELALSARGPTSGTYGSCDFGYLVYLYDAIVAIPQHLSVMQTRLSNVSAILAKLSIASKTQ